VAINPEISFKTGTVRRHRVHGRGNRRGKTLRVLPVTGPALELRLLGPLALIKNGLEVPLPASRKARALLAFLAVSEGGVTRSRLCELLWDVPNDPRGELRWCLSKLRGVIDSEKRQRIETKGDAITLDVSDCVVDAVDIVRATESGLDSLDVQQLRALHARFTGDFAEGLETDRNPQFSSWLSGQRRRFRVRHVAVLEQLVRRLADENAGESLEYLEKWLQLAPFDTRAHELLLNELAQRGRIQEAEEHLATTIRVFEAEGLDWLPVREAWKSARSKTPEPTPNVHPLPSPPPPAGEGTAVRRASICVMPFIDRTGSNILHGGLADGLTEDIITRLAKLRMLFVIARGSVYSLGERNIPPDEAARLLNVDYVASGSVRRQGNRITVCVELSEARGARVIWADDFTYGIDDLQLALNEIGNKIVSAISDEIEMQERNRAILKPPTSLNAWEAYHRGLWHVYRFNDADNARAAHFFKMAVDQDRTFAPAHAGLSFTHFQNAFLQWTPDRDREIESAYAAANRSLVADDRDPGAHWALGRALWLRGQNEESLSELELSVNLSPNFALGHYTLGFVNAQSGDARAAVASIDQSRRLSPFDPLLFAMLAARAISLVRLQQYNEAATWAVKGASRPNAHVHVRAIAANCLAAAGRFDEGSEIVSSIRRTVPNYQMDDFLSAFRFAPDTAKTFRSYGARVGL
jgi:DNA-binding SARP family transcriptional activator/TolB-like protein